MFFVFIPFVSFHWKESYLFWSFITESLSYAPKSFNVLLKVFISDLPITLTITLLASVKADKVVLSFFATAFSYLSILIYSSFIFHLPLSYLKYVHVRSQLG